MASLKKKWVREYWW